MDVLYALLGFVLIACFSWWVLSDSFESSLSDQEQKHHYRKRRGISLYDTYTALPNPDPHATKATERQPSLEVMLKQEELFQAAMDEKCGTRDFMPDFNPHMFNDPAYITYNNCYAYAFLDITKSINRNGKPQPGQRANLPPLTHAQFNASNFVDYVEKDYPGCKYIGRTYKLPECDWYVVALVLARGKDGNRRDYHWYRQDSNGAWTHKPGSTPVTNRDASGRVIMDPELCDRDYDKPPHRSGFDYDEFVGYFHVPCDPRWHEIYNNNRTTQHEWIRDHVNFDYIPPSMKR